MKLRKSRSFLLVVIAHGQPQNSLHLVPRVNLLRDNNSGAAHSDGSAAILLRTDQVVEVHLRAGRYNAAKVLGVIDKIVELNPREKILVLVITTSRSMVTYSGLVAVFSRPAVNYSMAKAYILQTRIQFFLAHLGKRIFRPSKPIRFFKTRHEAETWLKSFMGYGI